MSKRLDFSTWVENGFGTGDCVIVADEALQVIDYKHGVGRTRIRGEEPADDVLCIGRPGID